LLILEFLNGILEFFFCDKFIIYELKLWQLGQAVAAVRLNIQQLQVEGVLIKTDHIKFLKFELDEVRHCLIKVGDLVAA